MADLPKERMHGKVYAMAIIGKGRGTAKHPRRHRVAGRRKEKRHAADGDDVLAHLDAIASAAYAGVEEP
jgi:hypothetical protein